MLLTSSKAKIDRADKHLAELVSEISGFHARQPYYLVEDTQSEPGHDVYRVHIKEPIPDTWGTIVGDTIHNLRSALDTLAVALLAANGVTSRDKLKNAHFPIGSTEQGLEDQIARYIPRASPDAIALVRACKPYKGGNDAYWRLNQLDILDKHVVIVPVGAAHTNIIMGFDFAAIFASAFADKPEFAESLKGQMAALALVPQNIQYPLKDGDVVFRYGRGPDAEGKFKPKFQFTFDIAFGEGQIVAGEPVIPCLTQLRDLVKGTVDTFDRAIFAAQ
jgi:hypothetical protein